MQTIKCKPEIHLTIDIEHNDNIFKSSDNFVLNNVQFDENVIHENGVYRCAWKNNKWLAKEKREDKNRGNKFGTIVTLQSHVSKIMINQLVDDNNFKPYYFDKKSHTEKKSPSHDIRNVCLNDVIKVCGNVRSILDIGCGNGTLYYKFLKNKTDIFYTGIDVDPFILTKTPLGGHYIWENINVLNENLLTMSTSLLTNSEFKYDIVTFVNSLHYCTNIPQLFEKISKLTNKVIVVGIFEDHFTNDIELSDVKVKKLDNGMFDFYYKWKDHKITEKILKLSDLDLIGWTCNTIKPYQDLTNPFISMHQLIVLEKNVD